MEQPHTQWWEQEIPIVIPAIPRITGFFEGIRCVLIATNKCKAMSHLYNGYQINISTLIGYSTINDQIQQHNTSTVAQIGKL